MRDKQLLAMLIELYGSGYTLCAEWDEINKDFVLRRMIPYLDDHGPYVDVAFEAGVAGGMGKIYQALSGEVRFRNLIRTNQLFRAGQRAVFAEAVERIDNVLKRLDRRE